jgi:hypothetical protein
MVNLVNDGSKQKAVFTLTEKASYTVSNYRFTFTHVTTKEVIIFYIPATEDLTTNLKRYNLFQIGTFFENKEVGQYKYKVTDADTGVILETGSMTLRGAAVTITGHEIALTITGYNG